MSDSFVSIVIRNRNEAAHLAKVFRSLRHQEYKEFEIILVDNNSQDNSIELARSEGAVVVTIEEFTYGKALNLGIGHAKGELIVVLSSHSIPLGRYFLTECVAAFSDENIAAARLVYAGKGADAERWCSPELLTSPTDDFISKGPLASGCVIRKTVWEQLPFDETAAAAEDKIWAESVLRNGYSILSPIPAFYFYSKRLSPLAELFKNYKELVAIYQHFGMRIGFVNVSKWTALNSLLRAVPTNFFAFLKHVRYASTKAYLQIKFPR